ncbi:Sensor protein QseC [Pleomorphomonas sp. T1.2MG-36]|uniref:sensor histidine kinase n=1 Tax=Pleomorphomonas sp. T1.2MG-36 TaxID=3041167 RepID=UPI0024779AE6|nr:ATP-binding protein [Pleomorphomonas sp. T1.2MG-36]CAI9418019.1 Sensor protein QseC [Pleomorphomonas sp. T1.2MG-36]
MAKRLLPRSLRARLAIGLSVSLTLLWIGASLFAAHVFRHETDEVFDSTLREVAERILPLAYEQMLADEDGGDGGLRLPPVGGHEFISYVVRDGAGRELLRSSAADNMHIPAGLAPGFATTETLRTYTETAVQGTIVVTTAEYLDHRRHVFGGALWAFVWPLVALLPLTALVVWLAILLSFRPVIAFRGAIEQRGRGNLTPVDGGGLPSELSPVAAAVNALLARLRSALEAERSFTANSAHELRTPIAAALAQTQRLIAEMPDANRERARSIESALRRLTRLSEKLLQLAKAEGGGLLAEQPSDLAAVLGLVVDEATRSSDEDDRIDLVTPDDGVPSDVDPDAFAVLARNLIENALKHGAPDASIEVFLDADSLTVRNHGPVVAASEVERLMRPFERGSSRSDGSGLGLAIVAAVCRGAGLELSIASPVEGWADGVSARVTGLAVAKGA